MKYFISLFFTVSCFSVASFGQVYINVSGGYSMPIQPGMFTQDEHYTSSGMIVEGFYGSFGGGTSFGFNCGYKAKERWLFEVGCYTVNGPLVKSEIVEPEPRGLSGYTSIKRSAHGKVFNLIPAVGIYGSVGKVQLYSKSGFVIGLKPQAWFTYEYVDANTMNPSSWSESEETMYENIAFGFNQRLGASMNVWKNLSVSLEVSGLFQSWSPKYGELTKNTSNGYDMMPGANYNSTHYEYVDSYNGFTQSNPQDRSYRLKNYYSFSSAGVFLSVGYSFGANSGS